MIAGKPKIRKVTSSFQPGAPAGGSRAQAVAVALQRAYGAAKKRRLG